jgi:hypothetical protein
MFPNPGSSLNVQILIALISWYYPSAFFAELRAADYSVMTSARLPIPVGQTRLVLLGPLDLRSFPMEYLSPVEFHLYVGGEQAGLISSTEQEVMAGILLNTWNHLCTRRNFRILHGEIAREANSISGGENNSSLLVSTLLEEEKKCENERETKKDVRGREQGTVVLISFLLFFSPPF